ncbi:MAG: hypothetical protein RMY28_007270 [Nostoc sp. ChiSLP01]|nr:hypothetical protein [Nostoc sp. ChiSLP01]
MHSHTDLGVAAIILLDTPKRVELTFLLTNSFAIALLNCIEILSDRLRWATSTPSHYAHFMTLCRRWRSPPYSFGEASYALASLKEKASLYP